MHSVPFTRFASYNFEKKFMDTLKIGFLDDCMVIMWVLMWPVSVDKCYFEFEILKDKNWL